MKGLFVSLSLLLFCLLSNAQTTQEEYAYVVEGYKNQIEHGLNGKEGYVLKDLGNYGLKYPGFGINIVFKGLIATENDSLKAIMVIHQKLDADNILLESQYYCIPHPESDQSIWDKSLTAINKKDNLNLLKAYNWALIKYISNSDFQE